ncbi:MAG: TIGR03560 family F420-dependent LLM class oxidoreductase [Chloroflexota bacterium]|nr:MAG: TIGR03560 family F420-dependent LLM class oxidoreductase [Chloroflexota bacterium]
MTEVAVRKIRFGVGTPAEGVSFEVLRDHALEAESLGFDSVWLVDHLVTVALPPGNPQPESFTTLTALAASTSTIHVGAMVFCYAFRHPPLFANMLSTLDRISNGRVEFAVGAGWLQKEFESYGYTFPPVGERMQRLEEALQIFKKMWTAEKASFQGKYYHIKDITDCPKPVQKPHPPIWIGGTGEKVLLRLAAKYADRWNGPGLSLAEIKHKSEILDQHCREIGRNPAEVERTWWGSVFIDEDEGRLHHRLDRLTAQSPREGLPRNSIVGTPDQCIKQLQEFIDAGVTYFICLFGRTADIRSTQLFGRRVLPAFR